MRSIPKFLSFVSGLALVLLMAGCGGINASKSVSPLDFLLPGAGSFLKTDAPDTQPIPDQPNPAEKPVAQIS